ncbi:MAG: DUF2235 domain-containing protein [Oceanicaulis sp.]|nr:DUF2235 domain-containing protein [Oceanicaulis sp.]
MKRLIVCCDGTWQRAGQPVPTNVVKIARAILPAAPGADGQRVPQIVYYDPGVGAPFDLEGAHVIQRMTDNVMRALGGLFGSGMEAKICAAYQFLAFNYTPGDEIYLFGFSRGAFTVRSLAGMIYCSGLLNRMSIHKLEEAFSLYRDPDVKPASPEAIAFREAHGAAAPVRFLGCWDTVGMRGIPDMTHIPGLRRLSRAVNRDFRFHDDRLNRMVEHARHACAIDEDRKAFPLTPMTPSDHARHGPDQVKQVWFAGDHGGVGGGEEASEPLADIALDWMAQEAGQAGLGYDLKSHPAGRFNPQPLHPAAERKRGLLDRLGRKTRTDPGPSLDTLHPSTRERFAKASPPWRPDALKHIEDALAQGAPSP